MTSAQGSSYRHTELQTDRQTTTVWRQ